MIVCLVRHGAAVNVGEEGVNRDADRMLSGRGRKQTAEAARGLGAIDCRPDAVVSSPLVRARETAEIMAEALCPDVRVTILDMLAPGGDFGELVAWMNARDEAHLMLVGHMPDMAELGSHLLAARSQIDLQFKKAAACRIAFSGRVSPGTGCLEWLLPPRVLRTLSGA